MIRTGLIGALAAVAALTGAACGDDDRQAPRAPARAVDWAGCSPITCGGEGRPDYLIATITTLEGTYTGHGVQITQAMKIVLEERGWGAGDHGVGLQVCHEVPAGEDAPSPAMCRRTARSFARTAASWSSTAHRPRAARSRWPRS
jgi:hypothetical protein